MDLTTAGAPSRKEAMGNMAEHIHFDEVGTDSVDDAQERARKRREERKRKNASRKSQVLKDAFEPICKVMRQQVCLM